ncbi:MAG TPA: DUF4386 domain-containing protein [Chitinophagaceae bacterium]|nr:DUF4386 domain-containing protein [Chitinophagaceae bacterium]
MNRDTTLSKYSPQVYARLGGILYLIIIVAGLSSEFFFRGKLIVANNPAATANNLIASEPLWRIGILVEYLSLICTIVLAMIYFFLLRPVHKNLNLLATFFRLISIIVQVVAVLNLTAALFPLISQGTNKAFTSEQVYSLTNFAIKSHSFGYSISLLFLGCCFFVHGYLIFKSGFLPKLLGILIQIAGIGYLTNSFTLILAPKLTAWTFPIIILPVLVGETSLSLWLLIKGVDVNNWELKQSQNS